MSINLLAGASTKGLGRTAKIKRINRQVLIWAVVLFVCFVAVVGGAIGYFNLRLGDTRTNLRNLERTYASRASEVVAYVRSKQAIMAIETVMASRSTYREKLEEVYLILPPGVYLADADFAGDGILSFSGRADGVAQYEEFMSRLETSMEKPDFAFSKVVQTELVRNRNGNYRFRLHLLIKDGN